MAYQTQRDKVMGWIENGLIPKLVEKEYEYQDIVSGIAGELAVSESIVEDVVKTFARSKKLKIEHKIVATDEQMLKYIKQQREIKTEVDKIINNITEDHQDIQKKEGENGEKS